MCLRACVCAPFCHPGQGPGWTTKARASNQTRPSGPAKGRRERRGDSGRRVNRVGAHARTEEKRIFVSYWYYYFFRVHDGSWNGSTRGMAGWCVGPGGMVRARGTHPHRSGATPVNRAIRPPIRLPVLQGVERDPLLNSHNQHTALFFVARSDDGYTDGSQIPVAGIRSAPGSCQWWR